MDPTISVTKESIIRSSLRAFCKGFFTFFGIAFCLIIAASFIGFLANHYSGYQRNIISLEPDANGHRQPLAVTSPVILKITIDGVIGVNQMTTSTIESLLVDSRDTLVKGDRIKGVLLYINTPGGTVTDSNGIYEALKTYKEQYKIPIYAYVDGMCASGGMYISSSAERIYASSVSIIGSVGVRLGPIFNFSQLMEKWGVSAKTLVKGKDKDALNPFRKWEPGEDASIVAITDYFYDHFVDIVLSARPGLSRDRLINEYGAQVYAAPLAQTLGFIDAGNSSYRAALKDLASASGINAEENYQVLEIKPQTPLFNSMFQNKAKSPLMQCLRELLPFAAPLSELRDPFLYLYDPSGL